MERMRFIPALLCMTLALLLTGCDEDWSWSEWLTGERERGRVSVALAATPDGRDNREQVRLQIVAVELHGEGNHRHVVDFDPPKDVDLLGTRDRIELIDRETVQGGDYNRLHLRLKANTHLLDSYVEIDGTPHPLRASQGLEARNVFKLPTGEHTRITVHIDLRQSLVDTRNTHQDQHHFRLDSRGVRVVRDDNSFTLTGTVAPRYADCWDSAPQPHDRAVYLFTGRNTVPHDMRPTAVENRLVATAPAVDTADGYRYRLPYLPKGDYTLAFTCHAGRDRPQFTNDLSAEDFQPVSNIRSLNADREHDFQ